MERSGAGWEQDPNAGRGHWAESHPASPSSMAGRRKKSSKKMLERRWQSLEEPGSAGARRLPALTRSRTCDATFCEEGDEEAAAEAAAGSQGGPASALGRRAASFHKLFGSVAAREALLACFSCAWQKEVPYPGRLYISAGYVCFHCSLLLKDIKAVVPVLSISALKKTNTALLVPNALSIRTAGGEKFLFVSLRRREAAFRLLQSLCRHLQDNGPAGGPPASPLSSSVRQVLKKPLTWSQAELEQSTLELSSLPAVPDGLSRRPSQAEDGDEVPAPGTGGPCTAAHTTVRDSLSQMSFLNTIIIIYLLLMVALLLSSGYIGLRIAALERQLTALGAWPECSWQHPYKKT